MITSVSQLFSSPVPFALSPPPPPNLFHRYCHRSVHPIFSPFPSLHSSYSWLFPTSSLLSFPFLFPFLLFSIHQLPCPVKTDAEAINVFSRNDSTVVLFYDHLTHSTPDEHVESIARWDNWTAAFLFLSSSCLLIVTTSLSSSSPLSTLLSINTHWNFRAPSPPFCPQTLALQTERWSYATVRTYHDKAIKNDSAKLNLYCTPFHPSFSLPLRQSPLFPPSTFSLFFSILFLFLSCFRVKSCLRLIAAQLHAQAVRGVGIVEADASFSSSSLDMDGNVQSVKRTAKRERRLHMLSCNDILSPPLWMLPLVHSPQYLSHLWDLAEEAREVGLPCILYSLQSSVRIVSHLCAMLYTAILCFTVQHDIEHNSMPYNEMQCTCFLDLQKFLILY